MTGRLGRTLGALVLAVALVGAGAGALVAEVVNQVVVRPGYADDDLLVMLVIGSDQGPHHRPGNPLEGLADAIHLLVVDTRTSRMTIVDLPRDSWIAGSKVNGHLASGGPERLERVLEEWTGLPIDYWILSTFRGMERMVEGLGGIDAVVEHPMHDRYSGTNLEPGAQRLDAQQALAFTRDRRSVPGGDLGRTRNQGLLIRFAHAQMRVHHDDLAQVLRLVQLLAQNTVSNIPPGQLLPLALLALRIEPEAIAQETIRGPTGFIGAQSIVHAQPGEVFDRLRAGQVGPG